MSIDKSTRIVGAERSPRGVRDLPPSNVLLHPAFGCPPVINPKYRGPKKGTTSFRSAYRKHLMRQIQDSPPTPPPVKFPPRVKGRFNYPSHLLSQEYFCKGGDGVWDEPELSLCMLIDKHFASPLGALLNQLAVEGHDVTGAQMEYAAFREVASQMKKDFRELGNFVLALGRRRPVELMNPEGTSA